ncbi:hypothetical protein GIB67_024935 [Kingdonia uniflora]|uniref:Uncharacterized protein n=1 Tax=Kingdonia uniflora TaxID=39325 RepID=A0A7J7NZ15_9MAGN|nr:hypothetical protein GIB67_024935 [Kingdonia uniflora]
MGSDHFFVCCHSVGRDAVSKHFHLHNNAIQVAYSASYFQRLYISHKDVALPQVWPRPPEKPLNPPHARHETYETQYRAIFVVNCKMMKNDQVSFQNQNSRKRKSRTDSGNSKVEPAPGEVLRPVCCSVCSTEVGVRDKDEVYHFFNALPIES